MIGQLAGRLGRGIAALAICALPALAAADGLTVFAASSLKTALEDIVPGFEADTGHTVTLSFAATSALARQIQHGAPADLVISANPGWMDVLERENLIVANSRVDLISNTLVLIAPANAPGQGQTLKDQLAHGRVAMALVEAVPAGIYGKAALVAAGLWSEVAPRVVQADNVRSALAFVALGEVPLGIVYGSDAMAEDRVTVLATFPADSHPPIRYPAAVVAGRDTSPARALLDYLKSDAARTTFMRHGFAALPD